VAYNTEFTEPVRHQNCPVGKVSRRWNVLLPNYHSSQFEW